MTTFWADALVPFAEAANVRAHDVTGTLRRRILIALTFVDAERLHGHLFPGETMDWVRAREFISETACTSADWVQLVGLLTFTREPPTRPIVTELMASLSAGMRVSTQGKALTPMETLRLCFARTSHAASLTWDLLAKTLLLTNLVDVDASVALAQLLPPNVVESVLKQLPSHKHSRDEYTDAFRQLLSHDACHVAAHVVLQSIKAREERQSKTRQDAMAVFQGMQKPSLTRLLANMDEPDATAQGADTFVRFCHDMRLPGNTRLRALHVCYYFACLSPEYASSRDEAYRLLFDDPMVLQNLSKAVVIHPEMATLRAFLTSAQHFGPACPSLRLFRQQYVPGRSCSWTTVLRLYLASHCGAARDLWQHVVASLPQAQQHSFNGSSEPRIVTRILDVTELVPMLLTHESTAEA